MPLPRHFSPNNKPSVWIYAGGSHCLFLGSETAHLLGQHTLIVFPLLSFLSVLPWTVFTVPYAPGTGERGSFWQVLRHVGKEFLNRLRNLRTILLEFERNSREGELWISAAASNSGGEKEGFVGGRSGAHTGWAMEVWKHLLRSGRASEKRRKGPVAGQASLGLGSVCFGKRR